MEYFKAELLGTLILILIHNGAVAAALLARSKAQGSGWLVMALGTGAAVSLSVYAVGRVSGGHINGSSPGRGGGLGPGPLVLGGPVPGGGSGLAGLSAPLGPDPGPWG